ncbi:hypothetical protein JCM24511_09883 [Saitozyma sp. JCM 24511]|nr:hypothetical protein JCM24511_09883 [Saitozyma sp. JCM 24511]
MAFQFLPQFVPTQTTISVNPPGGTSGPHHPSHLPLPTNTFPHATPRFIHATHTGHVALWVFFAIFAAALVGVGITSLRVEKRARAFHWLSAAILGVSTITYLAMATGLGITFVSTHYDGKAPQLVHLFRQVYWARFINYLFTTPLVVLSLSLLAGLAPSDTLVAVLATLGMVVTALLSALSPARWHSGERARWGWFAFSCVGFVAVWCTLFSAGLKAAKLRPSRTRGLYYLLALMTFVLWTAYGVIFALTTGVNVINVDGEIIAYGVLDVISFIGFSYLILLVHVHGEDDTWTLPEWFVIHRQGSGTDGRGTYGAVRTEE